MKKLFLMGALCLLTAGVAQAETISGKVLDVRKNTITLRTEDGKKMTLHTTDDTGYREKKVTRKGKMHKGKMNPAETYYRPMVDEDDWVEITYTPATNELQSDEVQAVVVYDD
ncbi:MAG: hypothetical protein ACI4OR_02320 [Alphaproteobacteria bacterium]